MKYKKRSPSNVQNYKIKERDNHTCRLCGSKQDVQVHHITPKILGGTEEACNKITVCYRCHMYLHINPMLRFGKWGTTHSEMTKAGLRRAKRNGKILGRPRN